MTDRTLPCIALRCAYIRAGSGSLLCAVPLTLFNEQGLSDHELIKRAERRVEEVASDLRLTNSTVQTEIQVGDVATNNPAYNWPAEIEYND